MFAVWVAILAGVVVASMVICVSIVLKPEDAASVLAERKNLPMVAIYYTVLTLSRTDSMRGLAADTPFPILVRNCRNRAMRRLQLFAFAAMVMMILIVTGHTPVWWSR